ncbi:MAG TPA: TIGR03435 family protein [Vicinamibacterales bacterium]|nr:TIGR03435 family protein [Vicinamibacterales bacterium]
MRRHLLMAALGLLPSVLVAQGRPVAFDVVSIKPNRTNQGIPVVVFQPGGRLIAGNVDVRQMILVAYGLENSQLVNAPDWTATERFAIEARTADETPTDSIRMMLRTMLAQRFGMAAHQERRELPLFALTMARSDKRPGPGLRASGPECAPIKPPAGVPMPPPPPPPPAGNAGAEIRILLPREEPLRRRCGAMLAPGWFSARSITMQELTSPLTQLMRRPVFDETGLAGEFDLDVLFQPEGLGGVLVGPPPQSLSDAPALTTALQDELGLRLDPRRGPVDVLVVDRIERPTEN